MIPYCPTAIEIGDYVFACRWGDADWNDPWAIGFVSEIGKNYVTVSQENGELIPGVGNRSFRCVKKITAEQAQSILKEYPSREGTPFIKYVRDSLFGLGEKSTMTLRETAGKMSAAYWADKVKW